MKIYQYESYEEYKKLQVAANHQKLHCSWVSFTTIKAIARRVLIADDILCHGTRRGDEIVYFEKCYPNSKVIGTEISDTAELFRNTFEWDFHEVKDEWVEKFDVIYSNSFDHSYDPIKCIDTWIGQLKNTGSLCVELMVGGNNKSTRMDPLEIEHDEFIEILKERSFEVYYKFNINAVHGKSVCYMSKKQ